MTTTDLPVPLEAIDALEAADLTYTDTTPEAEVQAVAAPVVAAELRAQAESYAASLRAVGAAPRDDWRAYMLNLVVEGLTARADELDPQ